MRRQNGITVEDVLKMECMEKCKLIAGFNGLHNTVSKVNIMADPEILDWVDQGEFLLTTAYSFKLGGLEEQKLFIKECADKGLAGIGIKIYPYLESFPIEIIELANGLNLPIIDLYYGTPFSDIMTPVFKEIFNKQTSLLQRLERVHEQLMDVVLEGGTIGDIGRVTCENLRNPLIIKIGFPDQWFLQLESIDNITKNILFENAKKFYDPNSTKSVERKLNEGIEVIEGKPIRRMVMPIVLKDSIYGHIFSWAINTPLGGFDLSVLENASTIISLEILKQLSVRDVENRYRSEFLEDLLSMEEKRKEKAEERAHLFKLDLNDTFIIVLIHTDEREEIMVDNFDHRLVTLYSALEGLIEEHSLNGFVARKTDSVYMLLAFHNKKKIDSTIKSFSSNLENLLKKRFEKLNYKIGIGRAYEGLREVHKSYMDSLKAIQAGEILNEKSLVFFEDLGVYKILFQDHLYDELDKFYNMTIKSLAAYDEKKSTELIKTLEAYFMYNGNLKRISEVLFTHYNTTLYRIERIQKITGLNLENPEHRLNLQIGLKIKKLLGNISKD